MRTLSRLRLTPGLIMAAWITACGGDTAPAGESPEEARRRYEECTSHPGRWAHNSSSGFR